MTGWRMRGFTTGILIAIRVPQATSSPYTEMKPPKATNRANQRRVYTLADTPDANGGGVLGHCALPLTVKRTGAPEPTAWRRK